jgi:hypothetical protein
MSSNGSLIADPIHKPHENCDQGSGKKSKPNWVGKHRTLTEEVIFMMPVITELVKDET